MTANPPEPDNTDTQSRGGVVGFFVIAAITLVVACGALALGLVLFGATALLVLTALLLSGALAWLGLRPGERIRETIIGLVAAMGLSGWFGVETLRGRAATATEDQPGAPVEAFQDPLTTLPNRALFLNRLEQAIARGVRLERPVAVLFVDLDNFKYINDTFGHGAGDHLLISLAAVLQASLRASDTAARLGGDEFVVLLEDMNDPSEATVVAERIMQALQVPFMFGEREIYVTASVGIAVTNSPLIRPDELLHNADVAMYRAKHSGKSRYEIFDASMNREIQERRRLERDLAQAITRGELRVHYQPTVDLETGKIVGIEALLRWQHPERGLLHPRDFLSVAEETGVIVDIGRWVLREASLQARNWYYTDLKPTMSVNLSSREFYSADLPQQIAHILRDVGLAPAALAIEISERVVMEKPDRALVILQQLKAIGIHTIIDDFGAAFSSLRHLKRFPIDFLKIDHSYLAGLGQDQEDTVILSTLITVAHSLGLRVLAEGVETSSQAAWLRQLECDLAQGYYFAKPTVSRMASLLFNGDIDTALV